ncbi:hypothetical protein HB662_14875 [Roseomonas frigidaquae]|uniref:Uncharacterized protein n=1 Tax=Falsiroseomonas frigidaquae TaxID=487318 RepID=A0ABX1F198_9PROT|nr:hypothetical protein [Falsiroseomonas frigidaquae]NKE46068.1 hypothetical protein [Falsiroseomonas frigidaquae]
MLVSGYGWEGGILVLGSGLAAAVLSRLGDLAEIAAWGFSAKLREAQALADRAAVTAIELRRMAVPLARMSLGLASGGGRWGGHDALRRRTQEQVEALLAVVEASASERQSVYVEWNAWRHFDAALRARGQIFEALKGTGVPQQSLPEIQKRLESMVDLERLAVAAPCHWRAAAADLEALTPSVVEALMALEVAAQADTRPEKHDGLPGPEPARD